MPQGLPFRLTPVRDLLQRLLLLRSVLVVALGVALGVASLVLEIDLAWGWMLFILLLLAAANVLTHMRVRRPGPIPESEVFFQLLFDVGALSGLLYLSGGSTNPFVSLYLLPLVIAATTLPGRYAWAMAAVTATCYGLLFFFYVPLMEVHASHDGPGFQLHLVGMWINFVLSAGIIAFFVARMAQASRLRDAELSRHEEQALRNERIVALGTLAAGAAHELGTPLSTMAVVLGEMTRDHARQPKLAEDIATLRSQVDTCKHTITRMVAAAGQARAEGGGAQPVDEFVHETPERWRLVRPAVSLTERLAGPAPAPSILTEQTLRQAIVNLLNNAADASPDSVELDCNWDRDRLRLEIHDRGPGLSREAETRAGRGFFSTKPAGEGNGIGLLLARATLERLGGQLRLQARSGGGVSTLLELPLRTLTSEHPSDAVPGAQA
jgi:two-component system sensor histidine kinase RegB